MEPELFTVLHSKVGPLSLYQKAWIVSRSSLIFELLLSLPLVPNGRLLGLSAICSVG